MRNRSLAALSALALLAGCQLFKSSPVQKPAELVPIEPTATLKVLWQGSVEETEKNILFPAPAGGVIYAVGAGGKVAGFDTTNGKTLAEFSARQSVSGGVGVGNSLVLLGTPRGEVLAFDREGKPLWKTQLSSEILAPPEAQDGTVVARSGDNRIYGLDVATGKQKWVYQRATPALSVRTNAGLVIQRGGVFVGFPGGRLIALSLGNGMVAWEGVVAIPRGTTELERVADITSLPVVEGQQACAAAFQGRVACFDAARGTLLWARDVSSVAGLSMDARFLYVTDDKNAVLALDRSSGASIWRQDKLVARNVSGPLALGRHVVVGDVEGYVHLLSREDGSFAARIATDDSAISAPPVALDARTFVVQTRRGGIFAIAVQ